MSSSGRIRIVKLYIVVSNDRVVLSDEHSNFRFVGLQEGKQLLNHENWRKILEKAFDAFNQ
jgi:hypothetical protein